MLFSNIVTTVLFKDRNFNLTLKLKGKLQITDIKENFRLHRIAAKEGL